MTTFPIQVRTLAGLEETLAAELSALGATDLRIENRVVFCQGDLRLLYQANLWCRTAIRVLRPLATFRAQDEKSLYEGVRAIDWSPWLSPTGALSVDSHVYSSFTTHSLFVAQLVKDAVVDQFREKTGERPTVDLERPDLRIAVSLFEDQAQVFVDASGESLHKRGYRLKAGDAPLSETLAAGLVKLSGWDGTTPLIDPMTGSGTIAIEAGLILQNKAPGLLRKHFGFQKWRDFDRDLYEGLVAEAKQAVRSDVSTPIIGIEIDPEVAAIARENVERAGLKGVVTIETADYFVWNKLPTPAGKVIMNPPYDERLTVENIAKLYQRIGDRLKQAYAGWTAYVMSGNLEAVKYFGLRSARRIVLFNGAIECRLVKYELTSERPSAGRRWEIPLPEENPKWRDKAATFANRITKNAKHLSKWARREGISCWRAYDRDVPELPFIVEVYGDRMHFTEIERNHDRTPIEHASYLQLMMKKAAEALGIASDKIFFKTRKPKKTGGPASAARGDEGEYFEISENGHRFVVNLTDFVDTGIFLEQRKLRALVAKEAKGKDVLNLFSYTGTLSVYAAAGGAKSTTSVDTSSSYLEWADRNLHLNGQDESRNHLLRADALEYVRHTRDQFDIGVVDPPARSMNRATGEEFDTQAHHVPLLRAVLDRVRPGGKVFFCTSYRSFKMSDEIKEGRKLQVKEITALVTSLDFERKPGTRCWLIEVGS